MQEQLALLHLGFLISTLLCPSPVSGESGSRALWLLFLPSLNTTTCTLYAYRVGFHCFSPCTVSAAFNCRRLPSTVIVHAKFRQQGERYLFFIPMPSLAPCETDPCHAGGDAREKKKKSMCQQNPGTNHFSVVSIRCIIMKNQCGGL